MSLWVVWVGDGKQEGKHVEIFCSFVRPFVCHDSVQVYFSNMRVAR